MSEQVKEIWKRIFYVIVFIVGAVLGYNVSINDGVVTVIPTIDSIKPPKQIVDTTNTVQYVDSTQTNE